MSEHIRTISYHILTIHENDTGGNTKETRIRQCGRIPNFEPTLHGQ